MDWEPIQQERLANIRQWYQDYYVEDVPRTIRYMVLWAVFNALYNLAYLPKRKVTGIHEEDGHRIPNIWCMGEKEILKKFAVHLSRQDGLLTQLLQGDTRRSLEEFSSRMPNISQPTEEIDIEVDGEIISVDEFQGIASIDRRFYRDDGSVIYQYAPFDFDLNENDQPVDKVRMMRQLILFLYQLRNNIVHGGSAFISTRKLITEQALPVLKTIVDYILDHEELVTTATNSEE